MGEAATLENLWYVIALFGGAFVGLTWWVWNNLKAKAGALSNERLWQSHNALSKEFGVYQVTVAQTYVTDGQLMNFKSDLQRHIDQKFDDLRDDIRQMRAEVKENSRRS